MSQSRESSRGGRRPESLVVLLWVLLVLSVATLVALVVVAALSDRAVAAADLTRLSRTNLAWSIVELGWVAADLLAVVLAAMLRRWGWLVAVVLLSASIIVFPIFMLAEVRSEKARRRQQRSFEAATAQALAEQAAERAARAG
jgi:hypothetical protein